MSRLTAGLAIAGAAALALPATSGAWDDLPCGPTEATAHLCDLGEVARDGTIPNPLPAPTPVPVVPELVPQIVQGTTTRAPVEPLPRVVTAPKPKAKPRLCRDLPSKAGRAWFEGDYTGYRCPLPRRLQRRYFSPRVTG